MVAVVFWRIAISCSIPVPSPTFAFKVKSLEPLAAMMYITRPVVRVVGSGNVADLPLVLKPMTIELEPFTEVEVIVQSALTRDPPV
jgi:hypothetical protein